MLKRTLLGLPTRYKRLLQIFADVVLVWVALWAAFAIRIGMDASSAALAKNSWLLWVAPLVAIPSFIPLGMYRAVIRYLGKDALIAIAKAISLSSLLLALVVYVKGTEAGIPRSFVFNYWMISLLLMGGLRLLMRQYFSGNWFSSSHAKNADSAAQRVAIYGAGSSGNQLLMALRMSRDMLPVAFIDDDPSIYKRSIAGLKVYDSAHIERMLKETGAKQILLAIPSASRGRRREIIEMLKTYPVHVRTIPGFMDLASGRVKVQDLRDVDISDLLGRDEVEPHQELFDQCIKGKVVMVTGAGGSIGSELCRQIVQSGATTLVLYEHSEFNLYSIHHELVDQVQHQSLPIRVVPILGSIRNYKRLNKVMSGWKVNTVYHAAAYKHVPMI